MSAMDPGPAKPITSAPIPGSAAWTRVSPRLHARNSGGHLAEPERLRAMVEERLERTRGELASVREAVEHASGVPEWTFPTLALRWSERQHLAELELAEALLADLDGLADTPQEQGRQARGDAPTPG
ncbi:hypothetical protein [Streptomyces sp. NPDC090036]|uniref:hypothetical protein n=1 Tax=Streptomyces sp. NPDC090036 TaxID=3365926 RepID=UPI0037F7900C